MLGKIYVDGRWFTQRNASNITKTRLTHQITVATLHILIKMAYHDYMEKKVENHKEFVMLTTNK